MKAKSTTKVILTKEELQRLMVDAVKAYKEEEKRVIQNKRYRNTELLLRNYNALQDHYKHAIDNIQDTGDILDIEYQGNDELYIASIRRTKLRTHVMLSHIDAAMEGLKEKMGAAGEPGKYQVLVGLYIEDKSFGDIAIEQNCSEITARRWRKDAIDELSILLFGIDGLKLEF